MSETRCLGTAYLTQCYTLDILVLIAPNYILQIYLIHYHSHYYIFIINTSGVISGDCFSHNILGIRPHIQEYDILDLGPLQALQWF